MTILEKILQRKIDKINRSMYDDTDFCGRYHIHRIRKYNSNYVTLEFNDKETSYIKQETHTAKEWLSNELVYYFIAEAIRESNNSLYSNKQLQRKKIIDEANMYKKITKTLGPKPTKTPVPEEPKEKEKDKKKKKEKSDSKSYAKRIEQYEVVTDFRTLMDLPLEKGVVYYTIDTDEVFCDTETQRIKLQEF